MSRANEIVKALREQHHKILAKHGPKTRCVVYLNKQDYVELLLENERNGTVGDCGSTTVVGLPFQLSRAARPSEVFRIGESSGGWETVVTDCRYCGCDTTMLGTRLCDGCYELSSRIRGAPYDLLRRVLQNERPEFIPEVGDPHDP